MKYETAGDPVSGLRWTRKTTEKIADELSALDIRVSRKTVAKLLKQMNFSLQTNKKKISNGSPLNSVTVTYRLPIPVIIFVVKPSSVSGRSLTLAIEDMLLSS